MSTNMGRKCRGRRSYDKNFIHKIVESIENGTVRSAITKEHGIARSVLSGWMLRVCQLNELAKITNDFESGDFQIINLPVL